MEGQPLRTHQKTYDAVFQHPIARNLQWRDVKSMLVSLADATDESSENLKVTRNGQTLVLHPPVRKDFSDIQELMKIRRFLEKSGAPSTTSDDSVADGKHLLVVIDHRLARVYKTEFHGSVPERIIPYDAAGAGRHLHHVANDSNGQRKPENKGFYADIVKTLGNAENIIVFGSGTGASSAMDQLLAELEQHHADIAKRVVRTMVVDENHLTEDQLLAKAREIYAKPPTRGT